MDATIKMETRKGGKVGKKTSARDLSTYSGRVGALIRERRESLGISTSEMAKRCSVSEQTLYAWEVGRNAISLNSFAKIAAALGTTPKKLLPDS